MNNYEAIIEGILFFSGNEGVTSGELLKVLNVDLLTIENAIDSLSKKYTKNGHVFEIIYTAQTYKLATKKEYYDFFQKYAKLQYSDVLSPSSMETLAIIAYNQPITKFEIEDIKGVSPSHNIQTLQAKDLVEVVGRSSEIGRPNLYGVTDKFYDYLGINTKDDLPELKDFELKLENKQETLFDEVDDFKEIRKRLLNELNFEEKVLDLAEETIEVPTLKLFDDDIELSKLEKEEDE